MRWRIPVLLAVLALIVWAWMHPSPGHVRPNVLAPIGVERGLTAAIYQRLTPLMPYTEVVAIIGVEGWERSQAQTSRGARVTVYEWIRAWPPRATLRAGFVNGRLVTKSQTGIPGAPSGPTPPDATLTMLTQAR